MAEDKLEKLRKALDEQADNLDPAQREFVKAQFEHYEWNDRRIAELEKSLEGGVVDDEGIPDYKAESALFKQRHQLVAEQGQLFSHIMRWLKGTTPLERNELDEFLNA